MVRQYCEFWSELYSTNRHMIESVGKFGGLYLSYQILKSLKKNESDWANSRALIWGENMQYMWKYCMTMKVKIWKGWQPVHKVCAACLNSDKNGFGLWCTLWIRHPPSKGQKVKNSIHVVRNLSIWKWFSILGSSIFWAFTFKVDAHIFSRIEIMGSLSKITENVPNLTDLEARRLFELSRFEFLMNLSLVQYSWN